MKVRYRFHWRTDSSEGQGGTVDDEQLAKCWADTENYEAAFEPGRLGNYHAWYEAEEVEDQDAE